MSAKEELDSFEINILKKLLKEDLTYITKVNQDNNEFEVTNNSGREKYAAYFNMRGNPMIGLKGKVFKDLRKGKKYNIKELLNETRGWNTIWTQSIRNSRY